MGHPGRSELVAWLRRSPAAGETPGAWLGGLEAWGPRVAVWALALALLARNTRARHTVRTWFEAAAEALRPGSPLPEVEPWLDWTEWPEGDRGARRLCQAMGRLRTSGPGVLAGLVEAADEEEAGRAAVRAALLAWDGVV